MKSKNMFERISSYFDFFPSKSYVLDHSEYIDMHNIEKLCQKYFRFIQLALDIYLTQYKEYAVCKLRREGT